ncbi:MAG: hypothetical protein PHC34_00010 [Candidatus Gastranaerophilales bacterium]|nr:hypothetical protein [Candidatus Gastranaerophilales bacterium]
MDNGISSICPQYRRSPGRRLPDYVAAFVGASEPVQKTDRRQQSLSVENERRSGADRRSGVDRRLQQSLLNFSGSENNELYGKRTIAADINLINKTGIDTFTHTSDEVKEVIFGAASLIPGARRIVLIDDNAENHNNVKAAGLGLVGLINLKEDIRDVLSIFGLAKSEATEGYYSKFKFFNGTLLEKPLKKSELGKKIFYNSDITIGDLKFTDKIYDYLGIQRQTNFFNKTVDYAGVSKETFNREYVNFIAKKGTELSKSGLFAGKLVGLTMNRMPVLSLAIAGALELPNIIEALKNGNGKNQTLKSATSVGLSITTGALLSSFLTITGHLGPAGSIIGLGLGFLIGSKTAKFINSKY